MRNILNGLYTGKYIKFSDICKIYADAKELPDSFITKKKSKSLYIAINYRCHT